MPEKEASAANKKILVFVYILCCKKLNCESFCKCMNVLRVWTESCVTRMLRLCIYVVTRTVQFLRNLGEEVAIEDFGYLQKLLRINTLLFEYAIYGHACASEFVCKPCDASFLQL